MKKTAYFIFIIILASTSGLNFAGAQNESEYTVNDASMLKLEQMNNENNPLESNSKEKLEISEQSEKGIPPKNIALEKQAISNSRTIGIMMLIAVMMIIAIKYIRY